MTSQTAALYVHRAPVSAIFDHIKKEKTKFNLDALRLVRISLWLSQVNGCGVLAISHHAYKDVIRYKFRTESAARIMGLVCHSCQLQWRYFSQSLEWTNISEHILRLPFDFF